MTATKSVRILKAGPEHVVPISRLIELYRFRHSGEEAEGFLLPVGEDEVRALVSEGRFFIAATEGEFAGCASLMEYDGIAELRSLAVEERFQRRGIASKLIKRCQEAAREKGYDTLHTLTQTYATGAFEGMGFARATVPIPKLEKDCAYCPLHNNGCVEVPMTVQLTDRLEKGLEC